MSSDYNPCPACQEFRAEGDFESALSCHVCKGTGALRKPETYVCNNCGSPMCQEDSKHPLGLVRARISGSWDSVHLSEDVTYEFSLCEACLRTAFNLFTIPPKIWCLMGEGTETYADECGWYEYRRWKKAGHHRSKLLQGLCNATIECEAEAVWRHMVSGRMTDEAGCEEHKDAFRYGNTILVPAHYFKGIHRDQTLSKEQEIQVVNAYLEAVADPKEVTFFEYLPGCVSDLAEKDESSYAALWMPSHFDSDSFESLLNPSFIPNRIALCGGTLFVAPKDSIKNLPPYVRVHSDYLFQAGVEDGA